MALNLSTNIVIVTVVFSVLAIVAVIFRFIARVKQGATLALDDYFIIPALVRRKRRESGFKVGEANLRPLSLTVG